MTPANEPRCPACGGPNACAPAASGRFDTPCWCASVTVSPAAIAALPAAERGRACVCQRCATAGGATADDVTAGGATTASAIVPASR